jgi:hypothetical protein
MQCYIPQKGLAYTIVKHLITGNFRVSSIRDVGSTAKDGKK